MENPLELTFNEVILSQSDTHGLIWQRWLYGLHWLNWYSEDIVHAHPYNQQFCLSKINNSFNTSFRMVLNLASLSNRSQIDYPFWIKSIWAWLKLQDIQSNKSIFQNIISQTCYINVNNQKRNYSLRPRDIKHVKGDVFSAVGLLQRCPLLAAMHSGEASTGPVAYHSSAALPVSGGRTLPYHWTIQTLFTLQRGKGWNRWY